MKIIAIAFLYIASSQCGVLKDDLKSNGFGSDADDSFFEVQLVRVIDSYENGSITVSNEILIDVTKDKESRANHINVGTDTSKLPPGFHTWDFKLLDNQHPLREFDRILGIVEEAANKTGKIIGFGSTYPQNARYFLIDVGVTNKRKSKKHKNNKEIQNNTQVIDQDKIKQEPNEADSALGNEMDIQKCKPDLQVTIDSGRVMVSVSVLEKLLRFFQ